MARKNQSKSAAAAQAFIDFSPKFIQLIKESANATGTLKRLRPELEHLASLMWSKPVSVADAAKALEMDLSVKDMPKDAPARGEIQRIRVTLARALNDAGLLLKDTNKGRKTNGKTNKGEGSAEGNAETGKPKATQLDVILAAIPHLSEADLNAVAEAVTARIVALVPAKPAHLKAVM